LENVGNIVGKIYAFSTLGSIAGTFAAGFFLISWMGTRHIILVMGGILILTAIVWGSLIKSIRPAIGFLLLPSFLLAGFYDNAFKPHIDSYTDYYKESDYYTIKVRHTLNPEGEILKALILDNLTHSYVNIHNPLHLEYQYEKIYSEILRWRFGKDSSFRSLTIGGGGYTFPRYMEVYYPKADIDVVEIDPEITRVVYRYLGLPHDTRIRTYNEDGRWFVMNCKEKYDLIFIDAYNDLSIPFHLTTKEFARLLKDILNPNGILLTNIIDNFQKGSFLPSYIRTLQEVFGKDNIHVLSISDDYEKRGPSTYIVMTGKGKIDISDFEYYLKDFFRDNATFKSGTRKGLRRIP